MLRLTLIMRFLLDIKRFPFFNCIHSGMILVKNMSECNAKVSVANFITPNKLT